MTNSNTKSKYYTGTAGEHLVVAELAKRGFIASLLPGAAPGIDILAYKNGVAIPIQVKTNRIGSVSLNAKSFLKIHLDTDKEKQVIERNGKEYKKAEINRNLIWILVFIVKGTFIYKDKKGNEKREEKESQEFYICRGSDIQDSVAKYYPEFVITKYKGKRPRNWKTTHHGLYPDQLDSKFKNYWDLLDEEIAILSEGIKNARAGKG